MYQEQNNINVDAQVKFPSNLNVVLNQQEIPSNRNDHLRCQNHTGISNMNFKNSAVNKIDNKTISVTTHNLAQQTVSKISKPQNSTHSKIGYSGLSVNWNLNNQHSVNTRAQNINTKLNATAQNHPVFCKK